VLYFGSTAPAMTEALQVLAADEIHLDAMQPWAFPLSAAVAEFIVTHETVFRGRTEPRRAEAHAGG